MKSFIFVSLLILSAFYQTCADDDIELSAFETQGVRPNQTNGTVSEHIPFMVSIRIGSQEIIEGFGYGHICGGVFLSRQHILTVATCVKRSENVLDTAQLDIISGTRYRYDDTSARKYSVNRVFIHPDYNINSIPNNVAVIYISQEIPLDVSTLSTILISETPATINQNLQIFGWGTPMIIKGHRELQTGRITVLNRTSCSQDFTRRFCAGPSYFGGCQGDDGGAAVADGLLYGLVDYRSDTYCVGQSISPTHLYVDVVAHRDWIEATVFGTSITSTTLAGSSKTASVFLIFVVIFILQIYK